MYACLLAGWLGMLCLSGCVIEVESFMTVEGAGVLPEAIRLGGGGELAVGEEND